MCRGNSGYAWDSMGTFLCYRCGALFLLTPFGNKLVSRDARMRFPGLERHFDVVAWKSIGE